jgi:very-short-patch-repair endonuclease
MARRLSDEKWLEIKTRYQLGHVIRAIARDYDITDGAIRARAKSESWIKLSSDKIEDIKLESLHKDFNGYINVDIEKLKLIKDIFQLQSEQKKIQFVKVANKRGIREKTALTTIEQLLGVKLIRQFQVGGFKIDGYDVENKIAYEIDEEQHNNKKHSQHDILRQEFIEKQLQCKFVRIRV